MKNAKFLTSVLVCAVSLLLFSGCAGREKSTLDAIKFEDKVVVGIKNDSKPFGYVDAGGKLKGFDVDIAREVAKGLLHTDNPNAVEFKVLAPSERIFALNGKEVDLVIATMSVTPQRLEVVDFSQPYYKAGLAILTHKDAKITTAGALNNKNVAVVLGTTGEPNIRYLAPNARVRGARSYPEAFELLKRGEVDAVFADDSLLLGFTLDNKDYKIQSRRYSEEFYAVAIRKGDKKLKDAVNGVINQLNDSGELAKMRKKYGV